MDNIYTTEQKEFIRDNYNNPYDWTMFRDLFRSKFNREMTDKGLANKEKEDLKLYGDVGIKKYLQFGKKKAPRIKMGQLYVIEPFLLANGKMSREQTVFFRDVAVGSKTRDLKNVSFPTAPPITQHT
jgi:hypothetical protein